MFNSKIFLAELIGTFALVFIGAGAGVVSAGLVGVALAHGLTIVAFAYAFGYISGTHINPAVTFGLAANGNIKWGMAFVSYWIPQLIGAALAGLLLNATAKAAGLDIANGATVGALTSSAPILAMIVEVVLTFFLVNSILHTAVAGKAGQFAGLAIGLTLVMCILAGGPLTGASLNPARTFGIALFSSPSFADAYTYLIYLMGPLVGSTLAVILFNFLNSGKAEMEEAKEEMPEPEPTSKKRTVRKPVRASRK